MEGNPKAPKFLVEKHIEPPRDAYHQHVKDFHLTVKRFEVFNHFFFHLSARAQSVAPSKFFL